MNRDVWPRHVRPAGVAAVGMVLSVMVTIAIGVLGPSAVVPGLPGPAWQPPYSLGLDPGGHLVIAMEAVAIALGALGLGAGLLALRRGWVPDPRRLLIAGCVAAALLAFLPPSGSADHLNYAAYGRMAALGHDPYATGAVALRGDPVADAVEIPWQEEPSVYGPVATAVQALAGLAGGDSVRLIVFLLAVVNAAAFVVTGLLLHRFTRDDRARQARAALLWAANPLVIYQLVAGMHVDTLAIVFVLAALIVGGRERWWAAGPLLGLGIAVKINAGLVSLGPAWELRRQPKKLAVVAGTATLTVVAAYLLAGPHSLDQVLHASKSISWASPWRLVQRGLQAAFGSGAYRSWIQIASLLLLMLLATSLLRALRDPYSPPVLPPTGVRPSGRDARPDGHIARPGVQMDATSEGSTGGRLAGRVGAWTEGLTGGLWPGTGVVGGVGGRSGEGAGVAVVVVVAWLFATPYALPWYDGLAFALLAMVPATALDGFVVARLAVLSLAYLPARQKDQPPDLGWLVTVWRGQVVPWILLALTVALVVWALRVAARGSTRPGSAAPRP
ncbi:polyprenol phosphomannose-dependent alpha 1,6 mannosyltransferase MptB [Sphaerisporangium flaviroseum]|uniref:polyprenol phosphomannose-dependent alpha 1,6 mannosyltransferase MptB n=1 Tax=Sphaerisporangium flaviroseum TaxID=509199 RepID=UPI0031F0B9E0